MFFRRTDPIAEKLARLGVAGSAAERLSHAGTLLELPAGTTLCREGERGTQAFLVLEGTAQVLQAHGTIPVGPGQVVGEIATLDSTRFRNATVVAETDLMVLVFDVATFRSLARDADLHSRLAPARAAA